MAAPLITNRRPADGDADVSVSTPFRFGVRDLDTRADLSTIYCAATCSKAQYIPDALPEVDEVLVAASVSFAFSTFDDASGSTDPVDPCDQTIEPAGLVDLYRIEKSGLDGTPQEGVLFLDIPLLEPTQPFSFAATMDLAAVTPAAGYAYTTHTDFVGVILGLVFWDENTGVFLLFRDDGTKRISVVGPSVDGIGTRTTEVVAVYDWSLFSIYSIVVDPTVHSRRASVYATDIATGVETLLAEIDLDTINEFLPSVRMGRRFVEDSPTGLFTGVLGLDSKFQGDYLDTYYFALAAFGRVLLVGGEPTGSATVEVAATEAIGAEELAVEWGTSGSPTVTQVGEFIEVAATSGPAVKSREEPDLETGEWVLWGVLAGSSSAHAGTYDTGLGLSLKDGTREIRIALLDDFSRLTLGIPDSGASVDPVLTGYQVPADDVDWSEPVQFILQGSLSRDVLRLFLDDVDTPKVDITYTAGGYPVATESTVSFGVTESGAYSGSLFVKQIMLLPNCSFYTPIDLSLPTAQGWTKTAVGEVETLAGDLLELRGCTTPGNYCIYSVTDATYSADSGGALFFKAQVHAWTDPYGAVSPLRTEIGPIALIRTSTVAVQLRFIVDANGTAYAYLSHEAADYLDVLAQTTKGRAISVQIDLDAAHVFFLDVRPYQYSRLYIDLEATPSVDVAWPFSTVERALPANVPVSTVLAFGSLDEDHGIDADFTFLYGSIGRGYDIKVSFFLTEETLQSSVYGSTTSLLIDVQDKD